MIDFLLGVPGKLTTIYTHLTTYLSSTRCAKIDNLDTTISTRAAAATALSTATWTSTRAGYLDAISTDPTRLSPIATNFPTQVAAASGILGTTDLTAIMACAQATTTNTTLTDAVNITGSGILNFVSCANQSGTGNYQIQIIIDGVTVLDFTATAGSASDFKPFVGAYASGIFALDQIPFNTSLVIKHRRVTAAGSALTHYKLRRVS